jgi:hypothetical protein
MATIIQLFKVALLRRRLAHVAQDIEEIERLPRHLAGAPRPAAARGSEHLRAQLWFAENPPPPVGTTLRCLQGRR